MSAARKGAALAAGALVALVALVASGCGKFERSEAWNGEGVDEAAEPGLLPGHVHLFELVQWGAPGGGLNAGKRAERDRLALAFAKGEVELLNEKIGRGVVEERPDKVVRVTYSAEGWEKEKAKVRRPPGGKIVQTTMATPKRPNQPSRQVPALEVEILQQQPAREVQRTTEEARAFWTARLTQARQVLAGLEAGAAAARGAPAESAAAPAPLTRLAFAVLPVRHLRDPFESPRGPDGNAYCGYCVESSARRGAIVLRGLGGVRPATGALPGRAELEQGVEIGSPVYASGLDGENRSFDPNAGKIVLKLLGHCPARVFSVKEERMHGGSGVIAVPTSGGVAEWFELPAPKCADAKALATSLTDLSAGATAKQGEELDLEIRRLGGELGFQWETLKRLRGMEPPR